MSALEKEVSKIIGHATKVATDIRVPQQAELIILMARLFHILSKKGMPRADVAESQLLWLLGQNTERMFVQTIEERGQLKEINENYHISDPLLLAEMIADVESRAQNLLLRLCRDSDSAPVISTLQSIDPDHEKEKGQKLTNDEVSILIDLIEKDSEESLKINSVFVRETLKDLSFLRSEWSELSITDCPEFLRAEPPGKKDAHVKALVCATAMLLGLCRKSNSEKIQDFLKEIDPDGQKDATKLTKNEILKLLVYQEEELTKLSEKNGSQTSMFEELKKIFMKDFENKQNLCYQLSQKQMGKFEGKSDKKMDEKMNDFLIQFYQNKFKECHGIEEYSNFNSSEEYKHLHEELFDREMEGVCPKDYRSDQDKGYIDGLKANEICDLRELRASYQKQHASEREPSRLELKLERDRIREKIFREMFGIPDSIPLLQEHQALLKRIAASRNLQDRYDDSLLLPTASPETKEKVNFQALYDALSYIAFNERMLSIPHSKTELSDFYFQEKLRSQKGRHCYQKPAEDEKECIDLKRCLGFIKATLQIDVAQPASMDVQNDSWVSDYTKKLQMRDLYMKLRLEASDDMPQILSFLLKKPYFEIKQEFERNSEEALSEYLKAYRLRFNVDRRVQRDELLRKVKERFLDETSKIEFNGKFHEISTLKDPLILNKLLHQNIELFNRYHIRLRLIEKSPSLVNQLHIFADASDLIEADEKLNEKIIDAFFNSLNDPKFKEAVVRQFRQRVIFGSGFGTEGNAIERRIKKEKEFIKRIENMDRLTPSQELNFFMDFFLEVSQLESNARIRGLIENFYTSFIKPIEDDPSLAKKVPMELREFFIGLKFILNKFNFSTKIPKIVTIVKKTLLEDQDQFANRGQRILLNVVKRLMSTTRLENLFHVPVSQEMKYLNGMMKDIEKLNFESEQVKIFEKERENIFISKEGQLKIILLGYIPIPIPSYQDYENIKKNPDIISDDLVSFFRSFTEASGGIHDAGRRIVSKSSGDMMYFYLGRLAKIQHIIPTGLIQSGLEYTSAAHKMVKAAGTDVVESQEVDIIGDLLKASFAGEEVTTWTQYFGQVLFGLKDSQAKLSYKDILSQLINKFIEDGQYDLEMSAFESLDVMVSLFKKLNVSKELDPDLENKIKALYKAHQNWTDLVEEIKEGGLKIKKIKEAILESKIEKGIGKKEIKSCEDDLKSKRKKVVIEIFKAIKPFSSPLECKTKNDVLYRVLLQVRAQSEALMSVKTRQKVIDNLYRDYLQEELQTNISTANPFAAILETKRRIETLRRKKAEERTQQDEKELKEKEEEIGNKSKSIFQTLYRCTHAAQVYVSQKMKEGGKKVQEEVNERLNTGVSHLAKDVTTATLTSHLDLLKEMNQDHTLWGGSESAMLSIPSSDLSQKPDLNREAHSINGTQTWIQWFIDRTVDFNNKIKMLFDIGKWKAYLIKNTHVQESNQRHPGLFRLLNEKDLNPFERAAIQREIGREWNEMTRLQSTTAKDFEKSLKKIEKSIRKLTGKSDDRDFLKIQTDIENLFQKAEDVQKKARGLSDSLLQKNIDYPTLSSIVKDQFQYRPAEELTQQMNKIIDGCGTKLEELKSALSKRKLERSKFLFDQKALEVKNKILQKIEGIEKESNDLKYLKKNIENRVQTEYTIPFSWQEGYKWSLEKIEELRMDMRSHIDELKSHLENHTMILSKVDQEKLQNELAEFQERVKKPNHHSLTDFFERVIQFHNLIRNDDIDAFKRIMEKFPEEQKSSLYSQALYAAAEYGSPKIIDYLLSQNLAQVQLNQRMESPFHVAALMGNIHVVRVFLKHQQGLNLQNADKETALHLAIKFGDYQTVYSLIHHSSIDVLIEDAEGKTPFERAAECSTTSIKECVSIFLKNSEIPEVKKGFRQLLVDHDYKKLQFLRELFAIHANRLEELRKDVLDLESDGCSAEEKSESIIEIERSLQNLRSLHQEQLKPWESGSGSGESHFQEKYRIENTSRKEELLRQCEEKTHLIQSDLEQRISKIKEDLETDKKKHKKSM